MSAPPPRPNAPPPRPGAPPPRLGAPPTPPRPTAPPPTAVGGVPPRPNAPPPNVIPPRPSAPPPRPSGDLGNSGATSPRGIPGPPPGAPPGPPPGAPPRPPPVKVVKDAESKAAAAAALTKLLKRRRLNIKLLEARGLKKKGDAEKKFNADPYVKIKIGSHPLSAKEVKSKTLKKCASIVIFHGEVLHFDLTNPHALITDGDAPLRSKSTTRACSRTSCWANAAAGAPVDDPDQYLRVAKALEQVNGLKYQYCASPKEAESVLKFDSDDSDDESSHHRHANRLSRSSRANDGRKDDRNDDEDDDDEQGLSFGDHIDCILRKTRTITLLKIANNTAEVLPDDPLDYYEGEDFFCGDDEDEGEDGDSYETQDTFMDSTSLRQQRSFLRRGNRMRSATVSDGDAVEYDESVVAAVRLVRTLSSFLSLPRVISYKDLEMIAESLLDEQPSAGHHEDYGDLIDFHIDSARESSSAAGEDSHGDGEAAPLWKRRNAKTIEPLALPDDPGDLEVHQRRMFMEANRFSRFSSKNFLIASNRSLMSAKASMRQLGAASPTSLGSVGSFRAGGSFHGSMRNVLSKHSMGTQGSFRNGGDSGSVAEEHDEGACDEVSGLPNGDEHSGENDPATMFDEEQYIRSKPSTLAWINSEVEAKKWRRETLKKEAGKKPRLLLLYEASERAESKEPKK